MPFGNVAILGPHHGVDSWETYNALELLEYQAGFEQIVVLDLPDTIYDVAKDYSKIEVVELEIVHVSFERHGQLAHITALWDMFRLGISLCVFLGPPDVQLHNAKMMAKHHKSLVWEPYS